MLQLDSLIYSILSLNALVSELAATSLLKSYKQGFTFVEVIAVRSRADAGVQHLYQLHFEFSNIQMKICENNVSLSIKESYMLAIYILSCITFAKKFAGNFLFLG